MQHTIKTSCVLSGVGVHSGLPSTLTITSAAINTGIVWRHLPTGEQFKMGECVPIEAPYATVLATPKARISTIEHVMAALWACGITNAVCELDGDEAPILDGSSLPIIEAMQKVGVVAQEAPVKYLTPTKELAFTDEQRKGRIVITPAEQGQTTLRLRYKSGDFCYEDVLRTPLEFPNPSFPHCSPFSARTFGNIEDLKKLNAMGLARGSSLENTLAFRAGKPINKPRFDNEPQLHKILDLLGDLYLLGMPLVGSIQASNTGHSFNRQVVAHYVSNADKWLVTEDAGNVAV